MTSSLKLVCYRLVFTYSCGPLTQARRSQDSNSLGDLNGNGRAQKDKLQTARLTEVRLIWSTPMHEKLSWIWILNKQTQFFILATYRNEMGDTEQLTAAM